MTASKRIDPKISEKLRSIVSDIEEEMLASEGKTPMSRFFPDLQALIVEAVEKGSTSDEGSSSGEDTHCVFCVGKGWTTQDTIFGPYTSACSCRNQSSLR